MNAKAFFKQLRHDDIVAAIREAERKTSGEIRVFISHKKIQSAVAAAQAAFAHLGMAITSERNGVLIFVSPRTQKFAVIGDAGVHNRCGDEFWQSLAAEMTGHFKRSEFSQGIIHGVHKAGELLAQHFPHRRGDRNELPNRIAHD
ncbi:MAG: TPM domain-containing protein [Verrucomicrobia bacterium]|jgi:uncharacterized membrane protein|nr:TPM domain-containing protein [Verrucomicrobiota bacterium]